MQKERPRADTSIRRAEAFLSPCASSSTQPCPAWTGAATRFGPAVAVSAGCRERVLEGEATLVERAAHDRARAAQRPDGRDVRRAGDARGGDDRAASPPHEIRPRSARSGPSSVPSRSIAVTSKVRMPTSARRVSASATATPVAPGTQPWPTARPSRTSSATPIRSGPNRAARRPANAGSRRAAVPRITRAAPASRLASTARSSRSPPATSTRARDPTRAMIAATSRVCRAAGSRAPSRSTTWSHRAPPATNASATAAASSPYVVAAP